MFKGKTFKKLYAENFIDQAVLTHGKEIADLNFQYRRETESFCWVVCCVYLLGCFRKTR